MAIEIKEDLVAGVGYEEGPDGGTRTRTFKVIGLPRLPASDFTDRAADAVSFDGAVSIPAMFSQHPRKPGYLLEHKSVRNVLNSREQARIICQYRNYNYLIIKINGNVLRTETRFDVNGRLLSVKFDPTQSLALTEQPNGGDIHYTTVPVLRPNLTLEFERCEILPMQRGFDFNGRTNSNAWQGRPKHTWMCTLQQRPIDIFGRSNRFHCHYQFELLSIGKTNGVIDTWDPVLIYERPHTHTVPGGIDPVSGGFPKTKSGNGWKRVQVSDAADFDQLNLPNVLANQP